MEENCTLCGSPKNLQKKICKVCSRYLKLSKDIQEWNLEDKTTPRELRWFLAYKFDKKKLKMAATQALNKIIEFRKYLKQSMEDDKVQGIDLEHLFQNLFSRIGNIERKKVNNFFFQSCGFFDETFNPKQKKKLYRFFKRIFYEMPTQRLDLLIMDFYYYGKAERPII